MIYVSCMFLFSFFLATQRGRGVGQGAGGGVGLNTTRQLNDGSPRHIYIHITSDWFSGNGI